ncbi:hypothetical protein M1446_02410 [Candidatus Dependentiae bacterium]|nr:hypothetical protein [Candidatus Dependentiae bacterium]
MKISKYILSLLVIFGVININAVSIPGLAGIFKSKDPYKEQIKFELMNKDKGPIYYKLSSGVLRKTVVAEGYMEAPGYFTASTVNKKNISTDTDLYLDIWTKDSLTNKIPKNVKPDYSFHIKPLKSIFDRTLDKLFADMPGREQVYRTVFVTFNPSADKKLKPQTGILKGEPLGGYGKLEAVITESGYALIDKYNVKQEDIEPK